MKSLEQRISTSVLVVGAGGGGLRAAIELAKRGMDVLVVAKWARSDAQSSLAAGGINAALATMDPEDSWQRKGRMDWSLVTANRFYTTNLTIGAVHDCR